MRLSTNEHLYNPPHSMLIIHLPNVGLTLWDVTVTTMANMPNEATNIKDNA